MKIVIPGGSGQVGTVLARAFHGDGHDVIVLSRRPDIRPWRVVAWDGATLGHWQGEIDGCDVVINLFRPDCSSTVSSSNTRTGAARHAICVINGRSCTTKRAPHEL